LTGDAAASSQNALRPFSCKTQGIVYAHLERKGCNRSDARNLHQAPADRIVLDHPQENLVQSFVPIKDRPPYIEHGLDCCHEHVVTSLK
jgi:hypothetical protein